MRQRGCGREIARHFNPCLRGRSLVACGRGVTAAARNARRLAAVVMLRCADRMNRQRQQGPAGRGEHGCEDGDGRQPDAEGSHVLAI